MYEGLVICLISKQQEIVVVLETFDSSYNNAEVHHSYIYCDLCFLH